MIKLGACAIMVWAAIFWYSAGPIVTLKDRVTASIYVQILADHVHPILQTLFPKNIAITKMKMLQFKQLVLSNYGLMSM